MTTRYTKTTRDGRTYSREVSNHIGWWKPALARSYYPNPKNTEEIVVFISSIGRPFSYTEVIDSGELSMSRTTAYKALVTLEDEGRIRKEGRGRYVYVEEGTGEQIPMDMTTAEDENDDDEHTE